MPKKPVPVGTVVVGFAAVGVLLIGIVIAVAGSGRQSEPTPTRPAVSTPAVTSRPPARSAVDADDLLADIPDSVRRKAAENKKHSDDFKAGRIDEFGRPRK